LWPDDAVRAALARWRDAWQWNAKAAPVPDERLHLTLHFLGAVPVDRLPALAQAADLPFAPFSVDFGLPQLWHAGIAVLEPLAAPDALFELQARLGKALEVQGMPPEQRAYRPHVTMARRAGHAAMPADGERFRWHVDNYALVQSCGGVYTVLRHYPQR
jgi:RNA 2',3'-cyclic 3'-phosphodiesterase